MKERTYLQRVGLTLLTGALTFAGMAGGQGRAQAQESPAQPTVSAAATSAPPELKEMPIPAGVGGTMIDLRGQPLHVITVTTDREGKASAQCQSDSPGSGRR